MKNGWKKPFGDMLSSDVAGAGDLV